MVENSKPYQTQSHPLANFSNLQKVWDDLTTKIDWQAPRGLHWICEKQAYTVLLQSWFGPCVLGSIRSFFFLLCFRQGGKLGVPICEKRLSRQKWNAVQIGNEKDDKWPPE
jgi:hypothetical protein